MGERWGLRLSKPELIRGDGELVVGCGGVGDQITCSTKTLGIGSSWKDGAQSQAPRDRDQKRVGD